MGGERGGKGRETEEKEGNEKLISLEREGMGSLGEEQR